MSPKQRHRLGVFRHYGHTCFAQGLGGCAGRFGKTPLDLEAAHWISAQDLREERRKLILTGYRFDRSDRRHRLADVSYDYLIADPRNGAVLCFEHHNAFDGKRAKRLFLTPPPRVIEFAEDYGLDHLLATEQAA